MRFKKLTSQEKKAKRARIANKDKNQVIKSFKLRPPKPEAIKGVSKDNMNDQQLETYKEWRNSSKKFQIVADFTNQPRKAILSAAAKPIRIKLQNNIRNKVEEIESGATFVVDVANHKEQRGKTDEEKFKEAINKLGTEKAKELLNKLDNKE